MALTPPVVAKLVEDAKKLLDLWMRTKLVFLKAFGNEPITEEQENAYLQLKSEIQRLYRSISEELTPGLKFEGDLMIESMKNAISMEHLRGSSPQDRQKYFSIWHQVYIRLTRTLGALDVIHAGYYPHEHRPLLQSVGKKK